METPYHRMPSVHAYCTGGISKTVAMSDLHQSDLAAEMADDLRIDEQLEFSCKKASGGLDVGHVAHRQNKRTVAVVEMRPEIQIG